MVVLGGGAVSYERCTPVGHAVQPPQGVLVCDHAGLVINKFSLVGFRGLEALEPEEGLALIVHKPVVVPLHHVQGLPAATYCRALQGLAIGKGLCDYLNLCHREIDGLALL